MIKNPPRSFADLDSVSESWFIVVLNEIYLKSLIQAKNTTTAII